MHQPNMLTREMAQEKFSKETSQYFHAMEMVPLWDLQAHLDHGEYQLVLMQSFTRATDKRSYYLLVHSDAWDTFMHAIGDIFDQRINQRFMQSTLAYVLRELIEWPLPQPTELEYTKSLFELVWENYQSRYTVLVPLVNITPIDKVQHRHIKLANTELHFGSTQSVLATRLAHPQFEAQAKRVGTQSSFIMLEAYGDTESIFRQVRVEVRKALSVLRFATIWSTRYEGTERVRINPASEVRIWSNAESDVVYFKEINDVVGSGFLSRTNLDILNFSCQSLENAKFLGLDDINYHFEHITNPVSSRIIRALDFYDEGTLAISNWQAVYRYAVCVNIALVKKKSKNAAIAKLLETLIKHGGYIGKPNKNELDGENLNSISWDSFVERTASPFAEFYKVRGEILHGNLLREPSNDEVEGARELAHNCLRLIAKFARILNWQSDKQADIWFKNPTYLESSGNSE